MKLSTVDIRSLYRLHQLHGVRLKSRRGLTCSEVLCTGVVVVARVVGEATVVTMQGSCFSVVSSRDSALMNWGCSNT